MFAPIFQKLALTAGIGYVGAKAVMAPATRKALGKTIRFMDEAIQRTTDPALISQLRADRAALVEIYKNAEETLAEEE
jgi:hypothetical protein